MKARRVLLVGPNQQENLALQYLAAAAENAGHDARLSGFNSRDDLARVLIDVTSYDPHVVGLGMSFQHNIEDCCLVARVLRQQGYQGHVTCGGHVPTFCYEELLRDHPALDSCVRHEGEETLVELLDTLGRGSPLSGIRGLVHREGGKTVVEPVRPPQTDLDRLPTPKRDAVPYTVAGVPIAFLITARGCYGQCSYCSIGAFARSGGGPLLRLRDPRRVAQEIAQVHAHGVKIFFVQDDLFILPDERTTIERMQAITKELRARDVRDAVFWIKGRPENVAAPVLEVAREMGAIHLFLGIENACAERLDYLGRTHRPEENARALELCRDYGIWASFNLMLFDPECTLDEVRQNLDFAESTAHLPWNICRTEIYAGTRLLERLRASNALRGDYRSYGYEMRDARAELMFRILRVCFHERAFAFDSLLDRLISLSFAAQIPERLFPGPDTVALVNEVRKLALEVHRDSVSVLRRSLDFARTVELDDSSCINRFAIDVGLELGRRDLPWHAQAVRLWKQLHDLGTERLRG